MLNTNVSEIKIVFKFDTKKIGGDQHDEQSPQPHRKLLTNRIP